MASRKILYVCQEIMPYLPESELSSLSRHLAQAMQEKGNEIRTFMPRYGCINERRNQLHEVIRLSGMNLIIDDNDHQLIIKVASIPSARIQIYFIDNDDFFSRKAILTDEEGKVYLFDAQKSLTEIADRDYGYGGYYDEDATRAICYKSTSLFGVESYADGERMFYYYNANGTLLYTSNVELSLVTHSGDGRTSLYTGFNGDGERIYVRFYAS